MSGFRKRRSGSMFRLYFIQTTVSVLLCLFISSFSVLFFFLSFWKNDRLTALNEDALSVSQSVSLLFQENESTDDNNIYTSLMLAEGIVSTVAQSSNADIYLVNGDGKIVLCSDEHEKRDASEYSGVCGVHTDYFLPSEVIIPLKNNSEQFYNYEGNMQGIYSENYLLSAVRLDGVDGELFTVVLQAESIALLPYTTEFLRSMLFAGIIGVFISFILSIIISVRMVRPLKKITAATKSYAGGDFSVRINTSDVYNELSQLVDSVNIMADSLAVLEESRSSFVANISHELKTPMTIISGFVDGILDGTISENDTEKYLTIVSDEVKRLSRLVVAMLNMSKIEAGKLDVNIISFNAGEALMKVLIGFEKIIEDKKISIEGFDTMDDVDILADEALITQVFYNLFDNAVKFTPDNGVITVSLKREKKEAVISIKNTGKGISQEECGLIFDRFYKVDKSRGLDTKSFGLGLYIVRSIIEMNHGTISINSEIDSFTEFVIKLPIH